MLGPLQGLGHSWQEIGPPCIMDVKFQFLARGLWYLVQVPTPTKFFDCTTVTWVTNVNFGEMII